ncbi:MAG: hypothetical protein MUO26_11545 [Methanotrichaceae archaeon]|nr:hypothetical protein [Methanotrichaceae archaeon]
MIWSRLSGWGIHCDVVNPRLFEYERNKDVLEIFGNWDQKAKLMVVLRCIIFFSFGVLETLFNLYSLSLAIITLVLNALVIVILHRNLKKFRNTDDRQRIDKVILSYIMLFDQ